jgi:hypothetical protein
MLCENSGEAGEKGGEVNDLDHPHALACGDPNRSCRCQVSRLLFWTAIRLAKTQPPAFGVVFGRY